MADVSPNLQEFQELLQSFLVKEILDNRQHRYLRNHITEEDLARGILFANQRTVFPQNLWRCDDPLSELAQRISQIQRKKESLADVLNRLAITGTSTNNRRVKQGILKKLTELRRQKKRAKSREEKKIYTESREEGIYPEPLNVGRHAKIGLGRDAEWREQNI